MRAYLSDVSGMPLAVVCATDWQAFLEIVCCGSIYPQMPADLHNHAHHADGGERCTSSNLSDDECDNRDNRGQESQPWHQCDNDRHVAFAVEAVAIAGCAGGVESRAQILNLAFGFVFVAVAAFVVAFAFAGLPHACLTLRSRSPYAT